MIMKVELLYVTDLGYDRLNEVIKVTDRNWKEKIQEYISRTKPQAEKLSHKWETKGFSDTDLTLCVENIDTHYNLWCKIVRYVEFTS